MTPSDGQATVAEQTLADKVRELLTDAPAPLKLAELVKKLPKPAKPKRGKGQPAPEPVDFGAEVLRALDDEYRVGRVFRYPSGPRGAERFWARDEKQALREAALEAAATPKPLSRLKTAAGKAVNGAAPGFVDGLIRDLIGGDELFEHPAKTKAGGPLFGRTPPPPPVPVLEQAKFKKKLDALVKSAEKLLSEAKVPAGDLVAALGARLGAADDEAAAPAAELAGGEAELDGLILKAVAQAGPGGVVSLADLRRDMPAEYRGRGFDEAVLRLADGRRVRLYQDADPLRYTPEQRAELVAGAGGHLFTSVAAREDA